MKNKLIWKTQEKQLKELDERIKAWKEGYSKDGYIVCAEGVFVHRGVEYLLKVLRYFDHTNKFTPIGAKRISDKHAVIESTKKTKLIVDIVTGIKGVYDFLYHDTLHSHNDNQTAEEQIELCHELAKKDIDDLLDGEISKKLDEAIKKLLDLRKG